MTEKEKYVAFLRGINVGGHHKVPMADLKKELKELGFENIITILNSGNIIFDAKADRLEQIEESVSAHLENHFGFPVPTIVRKAETIEKLFSDDPFKGIEVTKDIRLYISLLQKDTDPNFKTPWSSPDESFKVLSKQDKDILSVLDLSVTKTPKAMGALEKIFGKNITTRNWKTIVRIMKKLELPQ